MNIERIPCQRIFYLRRIGPYGKANKELMIRLKEKLKEENMFGQETIIYGIAWSDLATPKEKCLYDVCVVVAAEQKPIEGMKETVLENGKYAIFEVKHTKEAVQHFWTEFSKKKLQEENSFVIDFKRPILERYTVKQVALGNCEFCVPID
ncbi:AraC family transcriptional regulator [Enterococcus crotali]|uniref:AraC family transcriptional regulator n=1 Tax=Enterococcus crotali TaxID=1453587 RepID=UPI00046F8CD3|nr:GyrI-like domain-containing protein [Enterococcus crotali]